MWTLIELRINGERTSRNAELASYARSEYRGSDVSRILTELAEGPVIRLEVESVLGSLWTRLFRRLNGGRSSSPPDVPCVEAG